MCEKVYLICFFGISTVGRYSQLGDGNCDFACNVESCGYDLGDCIPILTESTSESSTSSNSAVEDDDNDDYDAFDDLIPLSVLVDSQEPNTQKCVDSCNTEWLGDGVCIDDSN